MRELADAPCARPSIYHWPVGTRVGYLDMIGGASGDMLLGALVDAGVDLKELCSELAKAPASGYALSAKKVRRGAVNATLIAVETDAEGERTRTFDDFEATVQGSTLPASDKRSALAVFATLKAAEAEAHAGEGALGAHLHELGSVDTLVDVVGSVIGLRLLGIGKLHASTFPVSSGMSKSSHGVASATAPATQKIYMARGVPVRAGGSGQPVGEAVTPTGAAIIATLADFRPVSFTPERACYGAGQRDPAEYPNVLGLWVGESVGTPDGGADGPSHSGNSTDLHSAGRAVSATEIAATVKGASLRGGLALIETNLDDTPGEALGFAQERLFEAGALDVWFTPIQMKKNRPGVLLSALVPDGASAACVNVVLKETSTLGVRVRPVERYEAEREVITVESEFGRVPVKVKRLGGEILEASPEYEACREVSLRTGVPLQEVMRRVQAEAMHRIAGKKR